MSLLRNLFEGMRALFGQARSEREMDEELRGFLDQAIAAGMRSGLNREAAERAARVQVGSFESVKDGVRAAGWESAVEGCWRDVRHAVRVLFKDRSFTTVAVLTLALGIGANTAVFSLIDSVMLRPLPVNKPEDLLQVKMHGPQRNTGSFPNILWEQLRDRQDVFSHAFAWGSDRFDLAPGGAVSYVSGLWVSGDFFQALLKRPAAGRLISSSDDRRGCPAVSVLSYEFWQEHYAGSASAVGSTISLNTRPFQIIGVAPRGFYGINIGEKFQVAIPICSADLFDGRASRLDNRSFWWLNTGGRVRPGINAELVSARLRVLSPRIFAGSLAAGWSPAEQKDFLKNVLVAVPASRGVSDVLKFEQPLKILMGVVGLVLLIACANIASLMLARGAAREKEIALRQALGASRPRLMRQLLTECFLVALAGAALGVVLARWGATVLVRFISTAKSPVQLDASLDGRVLAFTAVIAICTAMFFGALPTLRATRVSLTSWIKGGQSAEGAHQSRHSLRKWIVATQVALSLVLLVAAGLLLRSFAKLATLDLGFDRNSVLLVSVNLQTARVPDEQQSATNEAIESRLRRLPSVIAAGRSVMTPVSGYIWNNYIHTAWSKSLQGEHALAYFNFVSPGFFDTLRMPLLAGRGFNERDTKTSPAVAVVSEHLARNFFPNVNPVGKTFRVDQDNGQPGPPVEVVGVVRDSKYMSLREETSSTAFFPALQIPEHADSETFELRTAIPPSQLALSVQNAIARVNKNIPLEINTLSEQVNDSLVEERMLALLSGFFGALALLLATMGLYGTLSYAVTQRRTEFGVRLALGAPYGSIVQLVFRDVLLLLAAGATLGIVISLATTRLLERMLFGLAPHDALTIVAAVLVLSVVALAAGYLPARRATKVDPIVALRYE